MEMEKFECWYRDWSVRAILVVCLVSFLLTVHVEKIFLHHLYVTFNWGLWSIPWGGPRVCVCMPRSLGRIVIVVIASDSMLRARLLELMCRVRSGHACTIRADSLLEFSVSSELSLKMLYICFWLIFSCMFMCSPNFVVWFFSLARRSSSLSLTFDLTDSTFGSGSLKAFWHIRILNFIAEHKSFFFRCI